MCWKSAVLNERMGKSIKRATQDIEDCVVVRSCNGSNEFPSFYTSSYNVSFSSPLSCWQMGEPVP